MKKYKVQNITNLRRTVTTKKYKPTLDEIGQADHEDYGEEDKSQLQNKNQDKIISNTSDSNTRCTSNANQSLSTAVQNFSQKLKNNQIQTELLIDTKTGQTVINKIPQQLSIVPAPLNACITISN